MDRKVRVLVMGQSKKKLIEAIRTRAYENRNGLFVPRVEGDTKRATWPVCMTCNRDVDSVSVEDVGKHRVTVRAKCHGKEAVFVIEFPYDIRSRDDETEWSHIQNGINSATFFDPSIA